MLVALLPLSLACLWFGYRSRAGWREAMLEALLAFGVATVLLTEGLSVFGWLHAGPLAAGWAVVAATALWAGRGRPAARQVRLGPVEWAIVASIAGIAGLVALVAVLSPPNSTDALGYHVPRVVYWAQAGSVAFFPVHYYPQLTMPPLAEYGLLHLYILSGGDRWLNLVQWGAMAGSVVAVSLLARRFGAGPRGQAIAALFCATLPNGILQASGVKNDYVLALWLALAVHFGLRLAETRSLPDAARMGAALGLALLTKGTGYLFAVPVMLAVLAPAAWPQGRWVVRALPVAAACALLVNAPQFARNLELSGSPLGFPSAHGHGGHPQFRWSPDRVTWRTAASNVLRVGSEHLGARSDAWNRRVYDGVLRLHEQLGMDVNDPATTWRWTRFEPPRNANHEANAHNRWHLLALFLAALPLMRLRGRLAWYYLGLVAAWLLFCAALRWQPFLLRMQLPLFVLGAPVIGALLERLAPAWLQVAVCLLLVNNARPALLQNWVRPLKGPNSVLRASREERLFADMGQYGKRDAYREAVRITREGGCRDVGVDNRVFQLEYPLMALLRDGNPSVRFAHVGVDNLSARYPQRPALTPCVLVCLGCRGAPEMEEKYGAFGRRQEAGDFLVFVREPARNP